MSDHWTGRLSEYLDGELNAAERSELESHLAGCQECAKTLEQLRQVVARAQALEDRSPAADLWAGIAARIGTDTRDAAVADLEEHRRRRGRLGQRRLSFSLPQLAAASVALIILSAGSVWLLSRTEGPGAETLGPTGEPGATLVSAPAVSGFGVAGYDAAIAELEGVIEESRAQLDTATVRIIQENLMIIDRAIAQAQRALAEDPASIYLNEYLAATMRQKLEFLRQAAQMAGAAS
ncbi:MAG: hypothetical protein AMS25_00875 [Gemmatimonas sp. SM23_52]|nr:MAG: hypothetical protein AMS25_00875 [Gemmatimonas sp. SM23_52]